MDIIIRALIALVLIGVICAIAVHIGSLIFDGKVKRDVKRLFSEQPSAKIPIITKEDFIGLPETVQRWLQKSGIIGKAKIRTVRLKQKGLLRTKKDQPWMPFEADQYYTTALPGFIWSAALRPAPWLIIKGRDSYYHGRGHMLIKFLSLIKVADARGLEMDQGSLLRYLNEIMWFPTAALSDYIRWEAVDHRSARATMEYNGVSASAVFYFNKDGDLTNFTAERYMATPDGSFTKELWETPISAYREFNGLRVPAAGEAVWKLEAGDFSYIQLEVIDIAYNL